MRRRTGWAVAALLAVACDDGGEDSPSTDTDAGAGSTSSGTAGEPSTSGASSASPSSTTTASSTDPATATATASTTAAETEGDTGETDPETDGSENTGTDTAEPIGEPVWMVVGNWGYRSSTADGLTWQTTSNPEQGTDHTPDLLRDVGWGNGYFVAVGGDQNSMVMRSSDGVGWEEDLHPSGPQWMGGVAYGNGRWVAVGGTGRVISSDDDAATWTDHDERLPAAGRRISYGGGVFVAVGDNGMIAVSEDGESWTDRTQAGAIVGSAAYGHGIWVAAGRRWNGSGFDSTCLVSSDTEAWSPCPIDALEFEGALFTDERLIVVHDGGYAFTTDGTTWTSATSSIPSGVAYADGVWVAASGDRRYRGDDIDALEQVKTAERGIRAFTQGFVAR